METVIAQRYFRSSPQVYEAMRQQLDAAFGYPNDHTQTVWAAVADAVKDDQGRCLLAVRSESCERPQVAAVLPGLIASGVVEEIDAATYQAAMPQPES
jgi:hypothetical protein